MHQCVSASAGHTPIAAVPEFDKAYAWPSRPPCTVGFPGKSVAPLSIPSSGQEVHAIPSGGTPMSTPPSAQGITAQLPFVDGGPEGAASHIDINHSYSQLPSASACTVPCHGATQMWVHIACNKH